ncbi:MAG: hypothetical protein AUH85_16035 [Chloroflexi bacterium 13_1_40CM_4_68_4]|nr:MAG: hypothetical protein AUH85_16035 [Chloroflexi bacterium 13_1_40CM_4_68_4]
MSIQFALLVAVGPWRLNTWLGSRGGVLPFHMPVAMIQACTSMPCACAFAINDASGSNGGGTVSTSVRGATE